MSSRVVLLIVKLLVSHAFDLSKASDWKILVDYYEHRNGSAMQIVNCTVHSKDKNCKSGLVHNYQTMKMIAAFGPLITGLFKYAFMTNIVLQDFLLV